MDGWRSTNHWNDGWMVGLGHRLGLRWGAVKRGESHDSFFKTFFGTRFFSMLGRFWEVLGGQNGAQNRFLGGFLSMFFSSVFWH